MTGPEPLLEVCVDCLASIKNAIEGGAGRLELCSALSEGGLTPSLALAKLAKQISPIPIFAMIRIRGGDFVYEQEEIDAMVDDLQSLRAVGIDGFVFGAVTLSNELDITACRRILEAANPLPVTFHRAFDILASPLDALVAIRTLGFSRILTSGQQRTAEEGVELIARMMNNGIVVVPGAGITERNVGSIREKTGAKELHGSAKVECIGQVKGGVTVTDMGRVREMVMILRESV